MTEFIRLKTPQETIQIGFTDQKVSGRAGLLNFAGFPHWHRFGQLLAKVLPYHRIRGIPAAELALGFLAGILAGAQKLAQVACLRSDVMWPALLVIQRIGSQSTFTRSFQGFNTAGKNLSPFHCLWRWCVPEWLDLLELKKLSYIVVARLLKPIQRRLKKELIWQPTEVPGTEAALSLAVLSYNLTQLFDRHLGWMERVTAATLRFRLFNTGGMISQTGGVTTLRLAVRAPEERAWWRRLLEKTLSLIPNCNAITQTL